MKIPVMLIVAALLAPGLAAAPKKGQEELVAHWQELLIAADAAVEAKQYELAKELAQSLLDEFDQRLAGGPEAKKYYAAALVRRSLADAGLGRNAEAQWDWDVARAFLPEEIPATTFEPVEGPDSAPETVLDSGAPGVTAPVLVTRQPPHYTAAARQSFLSGTVILQVIIDREGRVRAPVVTQSVDPGLDFAALEAIRHWRFNPAQSAGKPVAVSYVLTVQYRVALVNGPARELVSPSLRFPLRFGDPLIDPTRSPVRN